MVKYSRKVRQGTVQNTEARNVMLYLLRVGIALSVLVNVILLGQSNQTFSARNYGWKREGKPNAVWLIDRLSREDHCRMSWVYWITTKRKVNSDYD